MRRNPITVAALEDQESVAHKIAKYNLPGVPVLEQDGRVVGFVTMDDVIDVLIEERRKTSCAWRVEPGALTGPYFDNSIARVVRKRCWLLLRSSPRRSRARCCATSRASWPPSSRCPSSFRC